MEKTRLTGAQIRYLLVLERLNCPEGIRVSDIAAVMKVSKPSVHNMMDTFMALGFVGKNPGGRVLMTEYGMQEARRYAQGCVRIRDRLRARTEDASLETAICAFMAEASEACMEALEREEN